MTYVDSLDRLQAEMDAEAATPSPVRRRTVTEIVPGTYGAITIRKGVDCPYAVFNADQPLNLVSEPRLIDRLRAAAATLVALADALDEMAGDSK